MIIFRCATGESWQAVMLACKSGADCHTGFHHRHYQQTDSVNISIHSSTMQTKGGQSNPQKCGSDFAYAYFCSFVFLSSFLVS